MGLELTKIRYQDVDELCRYKAFGPMIMPVEGRLVFIGIRKAEGGFFRFLHWYTNYLGWCLSIANLQISRRNSLVSWLHPRITNVRLADDGTVF